jgi:acyl-CoA synthetase (AMP-forming)/AMP-acid ligase II
MSVTPLDPPGVEVNRGKRRWYLEASTGLLFPSSPISTSPRSPNRVPLQITVHKQRPKMAQTLLQTLTQTAQHATGKAMILYGSPLETGHITLSYNALSRTADERALHLLPHLNLKNNNIVLLHIDSHYVAIIYFWAIVAAGGIPCMSTPVSKDGLQRRKHLASVLKLLNNPLIITTQELAKDFADLGNIQLKTIEELEATPTHLLDSKLISLGGYKKSQNDVAVLMLTSGSTGNSKAVALTHSQILHAVVGKSLLHHTTEDDVFLNWTGLDHVANLLEIHLHAMSLGAIQIHVPSAAVLAEPMVFVEKLSKHKVSYTFAPNFFLANLVRRLLETPLKEENVHPTRAAYRPSSTFQIPTRPRQNGENPVQLPKRALVDLSNLRALVSGGESNVVQTCETLTNLLHHFGAPKSFIRPGFGMTETCAGSIYNTIDCPTYDLSRNAEFACLGECIPGMNFRIRRQDDSSAAENEVGELQVKGEVVFKCYYNNKCATVKSFTEDGWFKTGDRGFKDSKGRLHLTGRDKDTVVLNG